jgi:hypothetical protein
MCFSYQPDVPQGIGTRAAAPLRMPIGTCFSYTADAPQSASAGYLGCFSYTADVPPPASAGYLHCFSYSADAPQPAPPGLRRMPGSACFRY